MPPAILEVCAFNIQSCRIAERVGATRVELCDNPIEGGTTPSIGTIRTVREAVRIELYPIIRPRASHYWYNEDEFEIIRKDILLCKESGCDGISVGVQLENGEIDAQRLSRIVEWAFPMGVTCNRAFDAVPDPMAALETIMACGCERILTSGQASAAPDGAPLLKKLVEAAAGRISIMPGAGVRSSNVEQLLLDTGATEFHTSARKKATVMLLHQNPDVLDAGDIYLADEEELVRIIEILRRYKAAETE